VAVITGVSSGAARARSGIARRLPGVAEWVVNYPLFPIPLLLLSLVCAPAAEKEAKTASLKPEEIAGWAGQPAEIRTMLTYALELTGRGLTYTAGSADPVAGGTDCSGFVYHVLQKYGYSTVPRQSNEMYEWSWKAGAFRACNGVTTETFEFKELRPGDLLFWINTTKDSKTDRDPPVTHVMIYLGKRVSDGHAVCAGSSDGRTYDGQRMCGVSVFDFKLPPAESSARFIGYAHLTHAPVQLEPEPPPKPVSKPQTPPAAHPRTGSKAKTETKTKTKPKR